MARRFVVGAGAAAMLPAATAAALLVSAPFAGTRTTPLAASTDRAATGSAPMGSAASPPISRESPVLPSTPAGAAVDGAAAVSTLGLLATRRRLLARARR